MSKFIDAVKCSLTHQAHGQMDMFRMYPLLSVDEHVEAVPYSILLEHKIKVEWGVCVHCRPEDADACKGNVVAELRDAVYGDMRKMLRELERAFYCRDEAGVKKAIDDLQREIYG